MFKIAKSLSSGKAFFYEFDIDKEKKEDYIPEDRIVSDEEYEIIRKLEKEVYDRDINDRLNFDMWLHSTRRDLIGQPLDVIIEEMEKVDPKTLSRGWD